MATSLNSTLFLLLAVGLVSFALQVTPGSRCASLCLDSPTGNPFKSSDSTTTIDDITCRDRDYSTTDKGIKFRNCQECLQMSKKVDQGESDLKWYIYNLRYTIGGCLFTEPKAPPNVTVDSACNIDKACKPLKSPLTSDGLEPVPQKTFGYCTANDGAFMGANLSPCISCLQATEGQVYLSNFITALEAGCRQDPADGSILGLSGSVFSTNAVNITDPSAESRDKDKGGGLPPSAIAGIVIGVVFVFVAAIALFTVHWRREKTFDAWDDARYFGSQDGTPRSYPRHAGASLSHAHRRYYTGNAFGEKMTPYTTSGDYYDRMENDIRTGRVGHTGDPGAQNHNPEAAIPTHQAYKRGTTSRVVSQSSSRRTPSPPAAVHRPERTNTPDSFAVQAYLSAAEDSARLAPQPTPVSTTASTKPRFNRGSRIPSITLPSLSRLRIPKKLGPPRASHETMTPGGKHRGHEMQISEPVMTEDPRFRDMPIGGPVVMATERPSSLRQQDIYYDGYVEVPLRSGKSTLYGY